MAEVIEFSRAGLTTAELFACGTCGLIHRRRDYRSLADTREAAMKCCWPRQCPSCPALIPKNSYCKPCSNVLQLRRELNRFVAATKIQEADWNGPVQTPNGDEDDYYSDIAAMREKYDDEELELPRYVYACDTISFKIDVDRMIDYTAEDKDWPNFDDSDLVDLSSLRAFIAAWNSRQTLESWKVDTSRVVMLDFSESEHGA